MTKPPIAAVALAGFVLFVQFTLITAQAQQPQRKSQIEMGVWEGSALCKDGTRYYRYSFEPGDRRARTIVDILDGPGGTPTARGIGAANAMSGNSLNVTVNAWITRPFEKPVLPKYISPAEGNQIATSEAYGECQGLILNKVPHQITSGGIDSAEGLPPVFVGTIGCDGNRPSYAIKLSLTADGPRGLEGEVHLKQHPDGTPTKGKAFTVFGEFDPDLGKLTLVSDRWIEQETRNDQKFDFSAELRDRGQRLIGRSNASACGLIDLSIPGKDITSTVMRPLTPQPILEWDDASACVTLIKWAEQASPEAGGKSFYRDLSTKQVREIGLGLFADTRFVPYFGKSFEQMLEDEKKHVAALEYYCTRLYAFAAPMWHTGASAITGDYFSGRRPNLDMSVTRFRLLEKRLAREMTELESKTVVEADTPDLELQLGELEERFSELWQTDLAYAQELILGKLEVARGKMADRIEADISALLPDWTTLNKESNLRRDIERLGDTRLADQSRLSKLLLAKLEAAADQILEELSTEISTLPQTMRTLVDVQRKLNGIWPRLGSFVRTDGQGFLNIKAFMDASAESAFGEFETKVTALINPDSPFEEREAQYSSVIWTYQNVVPSTNLLSPSFSKYAALVVSLRPIPTLEDLVAPDGSPTNFALKLAVSDWLETSWSVVFGIFPYDLSFVTNSLRVGSVTKNWCREAAEGGFWCEYDLRMSGSFPFLEILSLMPYQARFELLGESWSLVEVEADSAPAETSSYKPHDYISNPVVPWEDVFQ